MFKLLTIAALIYLFYRFTIQSRQLKGADPRQNIESEDTAEDDFIDYEEVD